MVVGYALGNRNGQEDEILVTGEDQPNVITYSKQVTLNVFINKKSLVVPYSTIKFAKNAREAGIREILYRAPYWPENKEGLQSTLDLWGFSSYVDYLYTMCELGFLEGLIPVIEVDFLTPPEIKRLHEISAVMKLPLIKKEELETYKSQKDTQKKMLWRKKNLEWAAKLKCPISTSLFASKKIPNRTVDKWMSFLSSLQEKYGSIHEVKIMFDKTTTPAMLFDMYKKVREAMPEDTDITIPFSEEVDLKAFLNEGLRDLGAINMRDFPQANFSEQKEKVLFSMIPTLEEKGLQLQQRFPLKRDFIKKEMYSKKLGQVFDSYRYKIKKEQQKEPK